MPLGAKERFLPVVSGIFSRPFARKPKFVGSLTRAEMAGQISARVSSQANIRHIRIVDLGTLLGRLWARLVSYWREEKMTAAP
jgi:hypothetical protein